MGIKFLNRYDKKYKLPKGTFYYKENDFYEKSSMIPALQWEAAISWQICIEEFRKNKGWKEYVIGDWTKVEKGILKKKEVLDGVVSQFVLQIRESLAEMRKANKVRIVSN